MARYKTQLYWNIRERLPDAAIYGITMNPADTAERHGIPPYPIAAFEWAEYPVTTSSPPEVARPITRPSFSRTTARLLASGIIRVARKLLPPALLSLVITELKHSHFGFDFLRFANILIVSGGGQINGRDTRRCPSTHSRAVRRSEEAGTDQPRDFLSADLTMWPVVQGAAWPE